MASVTYRLALANAEFCRNFLAPQHGLILHSVDQYGAADRDEAALHFGLGAGVSVMAVVEASPAAEAGIDSDDRLLSVNGQSLIVGVAETKAGPSRASVQRAQQIIAEAFENGEIVLRVAGRRSERDVRFRAPRGCLADVQLLPGEDANAWADGERVVVSAGIVLRCRDDDDLALVIAHEIAHNLLHHGGRSTLGYDPQGSLFLPSPAAAAGAQEAEIAADRLAVRLTRAAGYDLSGAESFLAGLTGVDPPASEEPTHPPLDRRLALLRAEIAKGGR